MKRIKWWGFALLLSLITLSNTSCNDDEDKDKTETVLMTIGAEMTKGTPYWPGDVELDCMLVKEEKEEKWKMFLLGTIQGFQYEEGYEYVLKVKKTTLANPPMDGGSIRYELISVESKTKKEKTGTD